MENSNKSCGFGQVMNEFSNEQVDGMSPVTDLARNLSVLSTALPKTPRRRISWSNPTPSDKKSCSSSIIDSPVCLDSPMLQENVLRDSKNIKMRSLRKSCLRLQVSQEKENIGTSENLSCESLPKTSFPMCQLDFELDSREGEFSSASQESGYGSVTDRGSPKPLPRRSSLPSIHSSVFTDDETEDDDGFFALERFIATDDDDDNAGGGEKLSLSMTQLLKNPLKESANKCLTEKRYEEGNLTNKGRISLWSGQSFNEPHSSQFITGREFSTHLNPRLPNEQYEEQPGDDVYPDFDIALKSFKRPEPIDNRLTPLHSKRRKSSPSVIIPKSLKQAERSTLHRCYSETAATTIMKAVQKFDLDPDLVGDCTKQYGLPVISGRHPDLKTITPETLARLLKGEYSSYIRNHIVVDCRYPYEYHAGHIKGAQNIYTQDGICQSLLSGSQKPQDNEQRQVVIFHCEFSSERAPKLLRYLRSKDREINEYPNLFHPEVYILEGGYKAFFEAFKEYCQPQDYKPMLHKDHSTELREFRAKSKSWAGDCKNRPKVRSNLKF